MKRQTKKRQLKVDTAGAELKLCPHCHDSKRVLCTDYMFETYIKSPCMWLSLFACENRGRTLMTTQIITISRDEIMVLNKHFYSCLCAANNKNRVHDAQQHLKNKPNQSYLDNGGIRAECVAKQKQTFAQEQLTDQFRCKNKQFYTVYICLDSYHEFMECC